MLLILKNRRTASVNIEASLRLLGDHLDKNASPFVVSSCEEVEVYIETGKVSIFVEKQPLDDFTSIFVRKVGTHSVAAFILASYAKKNSIGFVDDFRQNTRSRTKLIQTFLLSSHDIAVPKTYFSPDYNEAHLVHAAEFLNFPVVVKQCSISRGAGVALARDHAELAEKVESFRAQSPSKTIILQEFIANTFEYRVFVTGNTIATAERKRRSDENEFRNNVYLGAKEEFFDPSELKPSVALTALKAAHIVGIQVAGVDTVENNDGIPVVFEVNSCPGFTLDETISDEIKMLSRYLMLCAKR